MYLRRIASGFSRSAMELKRVRSLATIGMLLALQVILGLLTIPIGSSIQISFEYLPLCMVSMLFGPVPAMLCGGLSDLIVFLIRPTGPFNPLFTLNAALAGLLYSLFLYGNQPVRPWRLIVSRLAVVVLCNLCINTLLLVLIYGPGAWAWIPGRLLKNAVEYPVSLILLWAVQHLLNGIYKRA